MNNNRGLFSFRGWPLRLKIAVGFAAGVLIAIALTLVVLLAIRQTIADPNAIFNSVAIALIAVWIGGAVLLAVVWFFLQNSVITPMERLTEDTRRLAQSGVGRTGAGPSQPLAEAQDEIGQIGHHLNEITNQVQQAGSELEARAVEERREFQAASDIGEQILTLHDAGKLVERAAALIAERFARVNLVRVFLTDTAGKELSLAASSQRYAANIDAHMGIDTDKAVARAARRGEPILTRRSAASPPPPDLFSEMQAAFTLPLQSDGHTWGVLDLQSRAQEGFTTTEQSVFRLIAVELTAALGLAALFEDLQERVNEADSLSGRLVGEVWRSFALSRREKSATVATDRTTLTSLQRQAVERGTRVEQADGEVLHVAVPIPLRGAMIGAIEWETNREVYDLSMHRIAEELASRLALAADNLRLLEQTQRQVEREQLLNTISGKLMEQTEIELILQTAVQELGQALRLSQTVVQIGEAKST